MKSFAIFLLVAYATCQVLAEEKKPAKAIAVLSLSDKVFGNITFTQASCTAPEVHVEVHITGLTPGPHGFHVHNTGDLSGGCLSTGGHYNPGRMVHGGPTDQVRHVGDLGNVVADADGNVNTIFSDSVISLFGLQSVIGRAIVVHAGEDDLGKTDHSDSSKTGNAGGRVACGVIGIAETYDEIANMKECKSVGNGATTLLHGGLISVVSFLIAIAMSH